MFYDDETGLLRTTSEKRKVDGRKEPGLFQVNYSIEDWPWELLVALPIQGVFPIQKFVYYGGGPPLKWTFSISSSKKPPKIEAIFWIPQ